MLFVGSEFGLSDFGNAAGRSFHLPPDARYIRFRELAGTSHLESGWIQELAADTTYRDG